VTEFGRADPPSRIEDYGLIGDCFSAALVSRTGSIDWLCWPRFDSDPCFAALLGTSAHGRWGLAPAAPVRRITRRYVADSLVLETVFDTDDGSAAVIDFMPVGQASPSLIRRVMGRRGHTDMRLQLILRFDFGVSAPWIEKLSHEAGLSAIAGPNVVVLRTRVQLEGDGPTTVASFCVAEGECVDFVMSWGQSCEALPAAIDAAAALARTQTFWHDWSARAAYKGPWDAAVHRSLLTLKALTYTPTGGIVAAPTTSLPEKLGGTRNWDYRYCWLRDATLALEALIGGGYTEEAQAWGRWLQRAVAGNPDDVQIMYGIAGERRLAEWSPTWLPGYQGASPVRVGNAASTQLQLDIYGEIAGVMHLARRAGLCAPLAGWSLQVKLIEHLETIWEQPDAGLWEVRGGSQQFTHSKVMTWLAFDRTLRDAEAFGGEGPLARWRGVREQIHREVCETGFNRARNSFTQTLGGPALDASLLFIPLIGFLPIDDPRVRGTITAIEQELITDGLVMRYRTETGTDGLAPGEGVFLACSFWLVEVYAMQGRLDEARALFARLVGLSNDLGLLSEEYDPQSRRLVGNFPQAFSHLALIRAALRLDAQVPRAPQAR
jgi:GH15 family glucan-1,4-alpha-glucosidase